MLASGPGLSCPCPVCDEGGKETGGSEGEREGCEDAAVEEGRQIKTEKAEEGGKNGGENGRKGEERKGRGFQGRRTEGRPY